MTAKINANTRKGILALAAAAALLALTACEASEPKVYSGRIAELDSTEAGTSTETRCPGGVCRSEEVAQDAHYEAEVHLSKPGHTATSDTAYCFFTLTADEYADLAVGMEVNVEYSPGSGCSDEFTIVEETRRS